MQPSPDKTRMDAELATVEAAPDASAYTFKLNPNAKWHDGRPLTTADVEYTYTMALNKATKSNRLSRLSLIKGGAAYSDEKAEKVSGIVVLDESTMRFDMEFPNALFLIETDLPILPKHILGSVRPDELEKHPFMFESPLGSGPFKAVKNTSDVSSETQANPDFYRGRPKLERVNFRIVRQAEAAQIALERGEVDFTSAPSNFIRAPDALERLLANPQLFVHRMPNPVSRTIGFNLRLDHWKDKRVRQAMAYAVDRKRIVDSLLGGNAEVVNTPIRHSFVGYTAKNDYAFNPDRAKQLLTEGGWDTNREVLVSTLPPDSETERATARRGAAAAGRGGRQDALGGARVVSVGQEVLRRPRARPGLHPRLAVRRPAPVPGLPLHHHVAQRPWLCHAAVRRADRPRPSRAHARGAGGDLQDDRRLAERGPALGLAVERCSDTYIFNRKVSIPHIPVPASNPKTISEVPFLNIVGNPYPWYNRIEEWTVKA